MNTKTCRGCNQEKPLSDFGIDRSRKDGLNYRCRECFSKNDKSYKRSAESRAAAHKAFKARNPGYFQNYMRQRKYGLTTEQYQEMAQAQGNKCAICQVEKPLVIDHDHGTGKVRGLVCTPCNTALGQFGDTVEGLQNAISYLQK